MDGHHVHAASLASVLSDSHLIHLCGINLPAFFG
jgi:hypothetical protein